MVRKIVFWTHLACGVAAGLVVLMMSVTGVLLTYERQMLDFADRALYAEPPEALANAEAQPIGALVAAVKLENPDFAASSFTVSSDAAAPASVGAGRSGSIYVNRYTGAVLGEGAAGLRGFFDAMTGWHRWFNADADGRAAARAVTGASNLMFLFLILSGMYLWLPRVFKWAAFRTRLLFNPQAQSSKARDFNWHHVFGIWSAVPLAIVVATAVVFSYGWANDLVYRSFGEEPPARGGRGGGAPLATAARANGAAGAVAAMRTGDGTALERRGSMAAGNGALERSGGTGVIARGASAPSNAPLSLDALLERATHHVDEWNRITMQLPAEGASEVSFTIDQGNGGQPQRRHTLILDARTGDVAAWQPFSSQSPARQARSWIRFLHTGEALGLFGQTVAGLVSLTSIIMVWTGLALAYRRLIAPLLKR